MKFIYIFMIFLTFTNLSSCTKEKYSVYYPNGYEHLNINDVNLLYLDGNYNSTENKTNTMCIFFKNIEDMIIFSEKENNNEYLVSIIFKDNTSVLMKYRNKKIFPETISLYKNGTMIKGLVKMDLVKYDNIDVTFYMNSTMELISGIKLKNDINNYKENLNLDKDENYNLNIMMNSLFILNSINNHIMNDSQFQARAGFGPIFQALGAIAMGIVKGVMAAIGILVGSYIVATFIVAPLINLIINSAKKALEAKKVDEKFLIEYKKSSALLLEEDESIIFDGDIFNISKLKIILSAKGNLYPIKWYIKNKPSSISYEGINSYFRFKDAKFDGRDYYVKPDGLIINFLNSIGNDTYSIDEIEKIKSLPNGESIIICFEFANKAIINGYYTDNITMEIK
ncbi:colicin lysis protein [Brachyspira hyodysenteriae]|uniref:hypothetical protein n=2 Tax=Brachyspira hyodysenteriae TaxID=159 RepID=UPI00063D8798|nr:hypothetical protein [Brachyspira hyodysenteriae]AUJ49556.1 hypothetical protein BH718_01111 [Brachyspira hyodysenteriae]KLI33129.1 colicin lysis protein [Brachyspira hyodysenteriae]KLI48617.1 colicin lysis protein [Brachyspira hyodysenteriae]KLI56246.1 colicin lysis protein [Brachyspira hyodysenteriae]KLI57931.1 colicin lysis protein [Brachyspira hyodysenteriae]